MEKKKITFALAFCNRGFMPGELIYAAREEMIQAVQNAGYEYDRHGSGGNKVRRN